MSGSVLIDLIHSDLVLIEERLSKLEQAGANENKSHLRCQEQLAHRMHKQCILRDKHVGPHLVHKDIHESAQLYHY